MKRSGPPRRSQGLRRSTWRRTRVEDPIPYEVSEAVRARAGGRCELTHPGCEPWTALHRHHRLRRSQGGEHTVANLILLCTRAHDWCVHAHPDWARRHGLILGAGDEEDVLVTTCELECPIDHREDR